MRVTASRSTGSCAAPTAIASPSTPSTAPTARLFKNPPVRSKAGRTPVRDGERALQRQPQATQRALFEEPPDERDAVRHATGQVELRQGMLRVGCPVTAGLRHLDETCPQSQRGMARVVGDREHLV